MKRRLFQFSICFILALTMITGQAATGVSAHGSDHNNQGQEHNNGQDQHEQRQDANRVICTSHNYSNWTLSEDGKSITRCCTNEGCDNTETEAFSTYDATFYVYKTIGSNPTESYTENGNVSGQSTALFYQPGVSVNNAIKSFNFASQTALNLGTFYTLNGWLVTAPEISAFSGQITNVENLLEAYYINWYVIKHHSDGWHVDGTLMEKEKINVYFYEPDGTTLISTVSVYTGSSLKAEQIKEATETKDTDTRDYFLTGNWIDIISNSSYTVAELLGKKVTETVSYKAEESFRDVTPVTPAGETPVTPADETPVTPADETPVTPADETPVTPADETPVTPADVTQVTPTEALKTEDIEDNSIPQSVPEEAVAVTVDQETKEETVEEIIEEIQKEIVEEINDLDIPEAVPEVIPEVPEEVVITEVTVEEVIEEEIIPEADALPETGTTPSVLFYIFGGALLVMGFSVLGRKREVEE